MQLKLKRDDANLFSDLLEMIAKSVTHQDMSDQRRAIDALRAPFAVLPVVLSELQVTQLQALLAAMLHRVKTTRPGFTPEAIRLMESLLLDLNANQKRQ